MIEQKDRIKFPDVKIEPEPQYDAILVHGYWMSEPNPGDVRLALRSRLAVRAAALAYNEGRGASHIVLPLGKLWGENYESTGNLMADELENKYHVPPQAIIREGDAYSTGGEVKTFLEIAQKNGWTKLLDIAFSKHFLTIPDVFETYSNPLDKKTSVEFMSVEEIIEEDDNYLVNDLVERLRKSRYEKSYSLYERGKWILMHMPNFTYESLEKRNKKSRIKKGKESLFSVDVYKL